VQGDERFDTDGPPSVFSTVEPRVGSGGPVTTDWQIVCLAKSKSQRRFKQSHEACIARELSRLPVLNVREGRLEYAKELDILTHEGKSKSRRL
jgi:hypothetical protein